MRINFFEEFPTEENLRKAKLIDFYSTIYLAAKSYEQFKILEKKLNEINPKLEAAYWPILEKSYWISPFSHTHELKNLIKDLAKNKQNKPLKVLIDLELPFLNTKLFLKNLSSFSKNKNLIKKLFENASKLNIKIQTAEYPMPNEFFQRILECLGVSYPFKKYPHEKILMFYTSLIKNKYLQKRIKNFIIQNSKEYGQKLHVGLGTIERGILGNEPILPPENLNKDLNFLRRNKIETAVIFRLGGLNKQYLKIIKKYI